MDTIKLTIDGSSNMTLLSNTFIDFYMKDANDAQIKLYLCLLRTVSAGGSADLSELADKLNYSEKDILRALKYWERRGVLSLSVDQAKKVSGDDYYGEQLLGIRLALLDSPAMIRELPREDAQAPMAEQQPQLAAAFSHSEAPRSMAAHSAAASLPHEGSAQAASAPAMAHTEQAEALPAPSFPEPEETKASYNIDELRSFKNSPETSWILTAAQQYIGRPLGPTEMRSLLYYYEALGFPGDLIDYLLQYCVEKEQKSFRYIDATAIGWAEQGIRSAAQARHADGNLPDKELHHIMSLLGRSGKPAPQETRFMRRWLSTYGFSMELIEEACSRAVLAVDANRFPYVETILKQWHEKGISTMDEVRSADEAFRAGAVRQPRAAERREAAPRSRSAFNNIEQQDYDFSELEKKIISNI